jgi:hypothetical protein
MVLGLVFNIMYNIKMKSIYKKILSFVLFAFVLFYPVYSFATLHIETVGSDGKIKNPISYNNINDFIKAILQGAIKIGIPIIALAIIYSGFLFVSARGNSEKLSEAKNALLYTCIGAAILLGAWAIAQLISETILAL